MSETKEKEEVEVIDNKIKPIFPRIEAIREGNTLKMQTFLRKKNEDDGKWYLWEFNRNAFVKEGNDNFSAAISSVMHDIYMCQLFGKVDLDLKLSDETPVFELSKIDDTEEERLDPRRFTITKTQMIVNDILKESLGIDENEITMKSKIIDDLGADSLDAVEIMMNIEKQFTIAIPDSEAEAISTYGELIALVESKLVTNKK